MTNATSRVMRVQLLLRTATILAGGMLATSAFAQTGGSDPNAAQQNAQPGTAVSPADEPIVVTGIRASLSNAANAKENNVGFTESVFADDIGDFPDTNLAESFNRVPGIQISREITGEGLNIAIRDRLAPTSS